MTYKIVTCMAIVIFLYGCSTPYTYPRYVTEMHLVGKKSIRNHIEKDDTMPVCLNLEKEKYIEQSFMFVMDCVDEERLSRPYEFSSVSARAYVIADGICARKKLFDKNKESFNIENVPKLYVDRCKEVYSEAR